MDLALKDKVALVAGSSRGIGKAIARSFLAEGARVVLSGRQKESLEATTREFREAFGAGAVLSHAGDLTDPAVIRECLREIRDRWGGLDSVVANIGNGEATPGWRVEPGEWAGVFDANLFGAFALVNETMPQLIERGGGSVVLISSIAGVEATRAPLAYSSAKAALLNYGKNLSHQVAAHGVRVNLVAPGNIFFPGGTWEKHQARAPEKIARYLEAEVPMARFGRPEEIADFVVFLCSEKASFATGMVVVVDGGQVRSI